MAEPLTMFNEHFIITIGSLEIGTHADPTPAECRRPMRHVDERSEDPLCLRIKGDFSRSYPASVVVVRFEQMAVAVLDLKTATAGKGLFRSASIQQDTAKCRKVCHLKRSLARFSSEVWRSGRPTAHRIL